MFTRIDIARCRIDSDVDVLSIFLPTDINIYRSEPTACRISRTPALKDYNGAHQLALQLALQPNAAVTKAGQQTRSLRRHSQKYPKCPIITYKSSPYAFFAIQESTLNKDSTLAGAHFLDGPS
ncbi:hypothetical protein KEM48_011718 [Puccinia striiformis f. sp. tritici PST-130]|nr:hypothetical protein KEM48_011718 [Puccinia striiformis f. sp. tritici PST-130]